MTADDWRAFTTAKDCSICHKQFNVSDVKVKDHDHITGTYRGAAHSRCNLQLRSTYKIPVFFHTFRGYDSHLIVTILSDYPDLECKVIGQGMEKYMSLSWGEHIVFKDTLQFMSASLETLAANLAKSEKDRPTNFKNFFSQFDAALPRDLLLRKGVYPYDYMDDMARFDEQQLPPREAFNSRLRDSQCSEADYTQAQEVWRRFNCRTMRDYDDIYLKTGILS